MSESPNSSNADEIGALRQKYVEGALSEQEAACLLKWLQEHPEAGGVLLDDLSTDAMLRELGRAGDLPMLENVIVLPRKSYSTRLVIATWAALAACFAVAATLGVQHWFSLRTHTGLFAGNTAEATTRAVAVLKRAVNVEWAQSNPARTPGSLLEPGTLHLKSGLVQVEFFTGARVLLEGPAELRLVSAGEAFCASGKLSADVPPQARGFRIGTPQGVIVDLGTEFGVHVDGTGSEVHVLKGEIELHRAGDAQRSLREGQALALVRDGKIRELAADPSVFANRSEIERRASDLQRAQMERWRVAAEQWNHDPSLLVHFDFEQEIGGNALANVATPNGQRSPVADAAIVGCSWTQGRWPGKRALEFRGVGDRVRLEVPERFSTATLAAWVRVDGLDRQLNSLFMCEGWSSGDLHWQIDRRGFARLGVGGEGDCDSPILFTPERFGQWVHLAVVYDVPGGEVRHYAGGKPIAKVPLTKNPVLRLGMAELGNWSSGASAKPSNIRNFSGAIDEFLLFQRALSDQEIQAIYSAGTVTGITGQ